MSRKKHRETHAAYRLAVRAPEVDFPTLKTAVAEGQFRYVRRQTASRSLCHADVGDGVGVYFVINRRNKSIITVLTRCQARTWL